MSKPDAATEAAANETTSAESETGNADVSVAEAAESADASAEAAPEVAEASEQEGGPESSEPAAVAQSAENESPSAAATEETATEIRAADESAASQTEGQAERTEAMTAQSTPPATEEAGDANDASSSTVVAAEAQPAEATAPEAKPAEAKQPAPTGAATEVTASVAATGEAPAASGSSEEEGALAPASPELEAILAAHERGERLEGKVIGWNKGGFHVAVNGVPAFCPKSQIEIDNPKRASAYIDRTFPFRVLEVKDQGKRVVLTRRQVLLEDREATLENLRQKKASGEPIDGKVTSITDFGAFVDVGGLEGLVHLSQLSRRRVESAREVVQIGQEVQVKVLKIEKGGDRISLSMKALEPDPWKTVTEKFDTGSTFQGTILRKADFGLFVEVADGIEGLVHSSNLELGKSMDSPDYAEGQTLEGWVREVDPERRRLSLSLREVAQTNPWSDIKSRYTEGNQVTGKVEQVARFGVFVELEPGLTGLLPFSSMPESHGPRPPRQFRPGDSIEVVVDAIDTKRRRVSLAPLGSKLEGTKSDYKEYQKKQTSSGGLGALAAAFEKIQES